MMGQRQGQQAMSGSLPPVPPSIVDEAHSNAVGRPGFQDLPNNEKDFIKALMQGIDNEETFRGGLDRKAEDLAKEHGVGRERAKMLLKDKFIEDVLIKNKTRLQQKQRPDTVNTRIESES